MKLAANLKAWTPGARTKTLAGAGATAALVLTGGAMVLAGMELGGGMVLLWAAWTVAGKVVSRHGS